MSKFNKDERDALYALFTIDEHEIREGATSKDKKKIQWFTYVRREAIIMRLDSLFFGEWESGFVDHQNPYQYHANHVDCAMYITIRGMRREYNGSQDGGGLNGAKGAATDAFKRVASQWGIGLYLQQSPQIWTENYKDENGKPDWKKKDRVEAEAMAKVAAWLKQLGAAGNAIKTDSEQSEDDEPQAQPANIDKPDFTPPAVDELEWTRQVMDLTGFLYLDENMNYNEFEHTASIQKRKKDSTNMGINPTMSVMSAVTIVLAYRATKDLHLTITEFPQALKGKSLAMFMKDFTDVGQGLREAWARLVDHAMKKSQPKAVNQ